MKRSLALIALLCCLSVEALAQNPVAEIKRFQITSATFRSGADVMADITNIDPSRRIEAIDVQVDVIDSLRRKVVDRLFIKLNDPGLGDRSIKPGGSRRWHVDIGRYQVPSACDGGYGTASIDGDCLTRLYINVVHFKDGTTWERKGWRDEKNPN